MKFWAVPVLAAVASHFVGCAEAGELGDKVLPFVEEVRMLADIRNRRERDKLQIELNETRYRETTRAISFLTASFDKQVEELFATKEPSTRDLFLQVLEAQGDERRADLLKREMAERELVERRNRLRARASQSKGKRSRSRSRSIKGVPVRGVWDFITRLHRTEKRDVLVFLQEIGRGALANELLEALDISDRRAIEKELEEMGVGQGRRRDSSGSKKSIEELKAMLLRFDHKVSKVAFRLLDPQDQGDIMRVTTRTGRPWEQPQLAEVPVKAVVELAKLTDREKLEFFRYLRETGSGDIADELLASVEIEDRARISKQLEEMGVGQGRRRDSSGSKKTTEELIEEVEELGEKVSKVAYEFLTPEEQDAVTALGFKRG